jgi:hypothetical protein
MRPTRELRSHPGSEAREICLAPSRAVLRARVEGRPEGGYRNLEVSEKLNSDVRRWLPPGEHIIDNSDLTPEGTADAIARACGFD